jgi:hypothetical protein
MKLGKNTCNQYQSKNFSKNIITSKNLQKRYKELFSLVFMKNKQFNSEINEQIIDEIEKLNIKNDEKDLLRKFLTLEKNNIEEGKNTYNDNYLEILEEHIRTK